MLGHRIFDTLPFQKLKLGENSRRLVKLCSKMLSYVAAAAEEKATASPAPTLLKHRACCPR